MHLNVSFGLKSDKHIGHVSLLGPGTRLLSPRTTLAYESMVAWSNPSMVGPDCGFTAACGALLRESLLSIVHRKTPTTTEQTMAGMVIDKIISNGKLETRFNRILTGKLLLKTLLLHSPNYHVGGPFQSMTDSPSNVPFNANVGPTQIHPTVNISSLRNISSVGFPGISSMDVNLQPLDLFSMDRSSDESYSRLQHSLDPENLPWLNNNGPKRASNIVEPKPPQSVSKRQRANSRNSCPPFKVRKEKL